MTTISSIRIQAATVSIATALRILAVATAAAEEKAEAAVKAVEKVAEVPL